MSDKSGLQQDLDICMSQNKELITENGKLREIDSEPKLHIHALNLTIADKDAEIDQLKNIKPQLEVLIGKLMLIDDDEVYISDVLNYIEEILNND